MIEIGATPSGKPNFEPLPPFVTGKDVVRYALPVMVPPSQITVTQAAQKHMMVEAQGIWQKYDPETVPYMVEVQDASLSRRFKGAGFVGPSQSGKTKSLETIAFHTVMYNQTPSLLVHMTRDDLEKWVEEKLNPTIRNSPDINDRLGKGPDDSTFTRKRFSGMRLLMTSPTSNSLSGGSYGRVLLTDVDHMKQVLGGRDNPEGTPVGLSVERIKSFLSRGFVYAESSCAFPVIDNSWVPDATRPHEMPPVAYGIAKLYNSGTMARLYWECRDCEEEFEPSFERLDYDASKMIGDIGQTAVMICPHCGCHIGPRHKVEFNRSILKGRGGWRHVGKDQKLVAFDDQDHRGVDFATYALDGAAAVFSKWSDLAEKFEAARRQSDELGDHTDLGTFYYTNLGRPFKKPSSGDQSLIGIDFVRSNLRPAEKGIAPEWARFIVVSVDVQGHYFPVQITAFGEGGQSQVVDRFDLKDPPETSCFVDGQLLDPAKHSEHWSVLNNLVDRVWPVAGSTYGLSAIAGVVDFQGEAGVSDNAEKFLSGRNAKGYEGRWFVSRGHGGWKHRNRFWYTEPKSANRGKVARSIKILNIATDRLKDTVTTSLAKMEVGSGAMYLPSWMNQKPWVDQGWLEEFIAEERLAKGWDKKPGVVRNEGTDLSVMARCLAEFKKMLNIDWNAPPSWALGHSGNSFATPLDEAVPSSAKPVIKPVRRKPRIRMKRNSKLHRS